MTASGDIRKLLKVAKKNGATLEHGRKHMKVLDQQGRLVAVLHVASATGFEGPGDLQDVRKEFRKRGWL